MDRQTSGAEGARDPRAAGSTSDSGASRVNAPWYEKRDAISVALNERFLGVHEEFMDYATEEYGEPSASVENLRDFGRGAAAASTSRSSRPTMRELREKRPERHSPGGTTRDALLASSWQRLSKYYAASNAVPLDVQSILQRENPYNWGKKFTKEQIKEGASELVVVSPQKVLGQALVYERWGNEAYEVHLKVKYGVLSARKFTLLAHYLEITLKMPEYASAAYDEALRLVQDNIILLRGFIGCVRYQRYLILCLRFSSWLHHAIFRSTAMETKRCNLKAIVDRFMERTQFLENLNETDRPREIEVPSEELIAVADVQVQNRLLTIAVDYWNEAEDFLKSTEHHRLFVGATESAMDKNVDMTSPTGYFLRFVRESLARIEKYDNAVLRPRSW